MFAQLFINSIKNSTSEAELLSLLESSDFKSLSDKAEVLSEIFDSRLIECSTDADFQEAISFIISKNFKFAA